MSTTGKEMIAYYNENNAYAAAWLRNLIQHGHIASGDVDDRDIRDVRADDLRGYTQCHFFAGIGIWSYALRQAGWEDDRQVWSGSCPCQPFSKAGQQKGIDDDRHLFPVWNELIKECRPEFVIGEQVAGKNGLSWFDIVQDAMETIDYTTGAVVIPACGFGAPHLRERLYWVSYANQRLGFADSTRRDARKQGIESTRHGNSAITTGGAGGMGNTDMRFSELVEGSCPRPLETDEWWSSSEPSGLSNTTPRQSTARPTNGFWRNADWLLCRDERWRCVESGFHPLANGYPARVGRLRAYGNAIVAPQAIEFVKSVMEILE